MPIINQRTFLNLKIPKTSNPKSHRKTQTVLSTIKLNFVDISKNTQNKNNNLKKNLESELIDIIN
jgi:hypothetical protein